MASEPLKALRELWFQNKRADRFAEAILADRDMVDALEILVLEVMDRDTSRPSDTLDPTAAAKHHWDSGFLAAIKALKALGVHRKPAYEIPPEALEGWKGGNLKQKFEASQNQ